VLQRPHEQAAIDAQQFVPFQYRQERVVSVCSDGAISVRAILQFCLNFNRQPNRFCRKRFIFKVFSLKYRGQGWAGERR
jgi:hypothetical protein